MSSDENSIADAVVDTNIAVHRQNFLFHHASTSTAASTSSDGRRNSTQRLQDHYKTGRRIGKGAFADVFMVQHLVTKQKRAVKRLSKANVSQETFQRELLILKGIDHPNVLRLYESFEDDNYYYLVTDLSTFGDLCDYLSVHYMTMTEVDFARLVRQILIAVNHCHAHGVVHTDLKPENILLDHNDPKFHHLTLCDFGFAQFYGPDTRLKRILGTSEYVAPEVFQRSYGPKADMWSVGVIAFVLLTGQRPFDGTPQEIRQQIQHSQQHWELDAWQHRTLEAKAFVQHLLIRDETDRPDASEVLQHSWLKNITSQATTQMVSSNDRLWNDQLRQFSAQHKLQQAVYAFVVAHLTFKSRKQVIDQVFRALDENCDGKLSHAEVQAAFQAKGESLSEEEWDDILERVDMDQNGCINYWEFVAATLNTSTMFSETNLRLAFEVFDQSNTQTLTVQDLKHLFRHQAPLLTISDDAEAIEAEAQLIDENVMEAMIAQVDANGDGVISFGEFVAMMQENIQTTSINAKRPHREVESTK